MKTLSKCLNLGVLLLLIIIQNIITHHNTKTDMNCNDQMSYIKNSKNSMVKCHFISNELFKPLYSHCEMKHESCNKFQSFCFQGTTSYAEATSSETTSKALVQEATDNALVIGLSVSLILTVIISSIALLLITVARKRGM